MSKAPTRRQLENSSLKQLFKESLFNTHTHTHTHTHTQAQMETISTDFKRPTAWHRVCVCVCVCVCVGHSVSGYIRESAFTPPPTHTHTHTHTQTQTIMLITLIDLVVVWSNSKIYD